MTRPNVVGIEGGKKSEPEPCQFCGHESGHPAMTCPRLKRFEIDDKGVPFKVWFFPEREWKPRTE